MLGKRQVIGLVDNALKISPAYLFGVPKEADILANPVKLANHLYSR
jgi:hypothetical protein